MRRGRIASNDLVERRDDEQRKKRCNADAGQNDDAQRVAAGGAGTLHDNERNRADNGRDRRHHYRAQAQTRCHHNGLFISDTFIADLIDKLHQENAVLCGNTDQHQQADLAEQIERVSRHHQPAKPPQQGQRHRDHNHRGMYETLELSGHYQEQNQQRQGEGRIDIPTRLLVVQRLSPIGHLGVRRQARCNGPLQKLEPLTEADTGGQRGADRDRSESVVAILRRNPGDVIGAQHIGQGNEFAPVRAHTHIADIVRRNPLFVFQLHDNRILLTVDRVGIDLLFGHQRLQRLGHIARAHAQGRGAGEIEGHVHLLLYLLQV